MRIFPLTECLHDHFNENQKPKKRGGTKHLPKDLVAPATAPAWPEQASASTALRACPRSARTLLSLWPLSGQQEPALGTAVSGQTMAEAQQVRGVGGRWWWKPWASGTCSGTSRPTSSSLFFTYWTRRRHSAAECCFPLRKPLGSPVTSAGPAGSHSTSRAAGGVGATVNSGPARAHHNPFPCLP